ncbi:MAG: hypothetical protein DDT40_00253 [candidate division WS2 bacterium]|nr:hypothetical protein [Candidatus Psychracetigena formicireducens]MBT9150087.1 hypothetical protein [Candidatus Psychracetigena formicireducens]
MKLSIGKKLNYLIIFIIVFSLLSGSIFLFFGNNERPYANKEAIPFVIGNKEYYLLVADEPREWEQGLMNYRLPVDFDGMLFVFPDKTVRTFWNKNTYLDLDIYWVDNEKIVGKSFLPSIEKSQETVSVSSPVPVDMVIELIR